MVVYIAGPYRAKGGHTVAENIQAAREAAIKLWGEGHATICPHLNTANFEDDSGLSDEMYLDGDLKILARCDGVVMLGRWQESEGAKGEHDYALHHGIPIWYWPDTPPHHPVELALPEQCAGYIDIVMRGYRVMLDKNADYSPANILGTGEVGLVTRLWDKVARLMNLTGFRIRVESSTFEKSLKPKNESVDDAYLDLANYAIIGQLLRGGKWGR